ncbi:transcription termination factor MTEF18, mitochondrial-like [Phragmites australis]|uniref:transcription termination factor MTEF18, mitochondrial-like n=1 Tax=Phragmites australis TaxID=29695 RepID=UPI002D77E9D6|nr:transcription termination factor MTEF18, mitochondrial-like [Phragmites australis]
MNNYLSSALRAARLRWVARIQLVVELSEPCRAPHWCAARSWLVQESSSTSSWGVTPIGHRYHLRPYSAAPARCVYKPLEEEEEEEEEVVDKRLRQMEKRRVFRAAQQTFLEYLHVTRGLCFSDAEHISKHSPIFVSKLLEMVKDAIKDPVEGGEEIVFRSKEKKKEMRDQRVSKALVRLFHYHPINEFEPFMESIGLKPSKYDSLLPRDLMFLADDETLLENYRVLCNYGVMRTKIGRIYRDAADVFSFGENVLVSKLRALEDLGFSKTSVIKLVISSPVILVRDLSAEFKILQWLDDVGIERDWIGQFVSVRKSYNWRKTVDVPQFFSELGFNKEGIGKLIRENPDFLLDGSGKGLFKAVSIMLKAGSGKQDLFNLFLDFPNVRARNFARNILRGIQLLAEIGVSEMDIMKFVVSNASMLGSAPVKKANSILTNLSVGKKRLCKIIMEEPHQLMKYTFGSKLSRLPHCNRSNETSLKEKVKFLKSIGFVEGSEDMEKALKVFRGKGDELQDRFDFLVKTGLDPKDVASMMKVAPHVLNQKIHVLESKISFFVNETGYPLSALVGFPSFLSFTVERTKVRFLMYNWLRERGLSTPNLALSSFLACSDKNFIKYFVEKHHTGHEVWENFKREVAATKIVHCTSDD